MFKRIAIPLVIGGVLLAIDAVDHNALKNWMLTLLSLFWAGLPALQYVMAGLLVAVGVASLVRVFRQPKRPGSAER